LQLLSLQSVAIFTVSILGFSPQIEREPEHIICELFMSEKSLKLLMLLICGGFMVVSLPAARFRAGCRFGPGGSANGAQSEG
jgi:hypothetical protein